MKIYAFLEHLGLTQWALLMWEKKERRNNYSSGTDNDNPSADLMD